MPRSQPEEHFQALRQLRSSADQISTGLPGSEVQVSPDLRNFPYVAYRIRFQFSGLASLALIPVTDGKLSKGVLGIEIVAPNRQIVYQGTLPLAKVKSCAPARYDFLPIAASNQGTFHLRVYVRGAPQPISILEYRLLAPTTGARRLRARALCGLSYRPSGPAGPLPKRQPRGGQHGGTATHPGPLARTSETGSGTRGVKSLWQSRTYAEDSVRRLTGGTSPHFMHYIKRKYLSHGRAARALSLGCGTGELDQAGYEAGLFERCVGLDISEEALQQARQFARQLGYPLEYDREDLNRAKLRERFGVFDLVFANASLHYVEDLEHLFAEVDSALKPDGLFFFLEYVGPSRFQWKAKTLSLCNRMLDVLPARLHPGVERIQRMAVDDFMNGEPSEAIRSADIMAAASMTFELLESHDAGTTLTHPLLNGLMRYFDEDDEMDATVLRLIFLMEEVLIEENVLDSDVKLAVLRKRELRPALLATDPALSRLPERLIELQAQARSRPGFQSETTAVLHADLYEYLVANRAKGDGVVEVGCFTGDSSVVLAYACRELGMSFTVIDINPVYLNYTRHLLQSLGLGEGTSFFQGTLTDFAARFREQPPPLLVFVDGDHSYLGVLNDIRAIFSFKNRPFAAAFHDFSLRSSQYEDIRVDEAILDAFGQDVLYTRIGAQYGEQPSHSQDHPSSDGTSVEAGGTEAVIVELGAIEKLRL